MSQAISKNTTFGDLIRKYPRLLRFWANTGYTHRMPYGIFETIEQGVKAHGS
jgi:hypothetical protein